MSWGLEDVRVTRGRTLALAGVTVPVDPSRITAGLYADLTVGENLAFCADAYRLSGRERSRLTARVLEQTGLAGAHRRLGGQLSGGMQRKLAVGLALLHSPELLVLDEPTSGVGPLGRVRRWEDVRRTAGQGAGVLVTTHNMEEAEQCDRLVVMTDGKVVAQGTAGEIIGDRTVAEVRCQDGNRAFALLDAAGLAAQVHGSVLRVGGAPSAVAGLLSAAAIEARVQTVPADLEEAFAALVAGPTAA
jgi:ABC-2 type transport system ATP-binding protein